MSVNLLNIQNTQIQLSPTFYYSTFPCRFIEIERSGNGREFIKVKYEMQGESGSQLAYNDILVLTHPRHVGALLPTHR